MQPSILLNPRALSRARPLASAVALAALVSTGCVTTKEEGEVMRRDIYDLRKEQRAQRDAREQKDQDTAARLAKIEERFKNLDERSLKGSADLGAELGSLRDEMARVRGQLETKEYQLRERELQLGASQQQVKDVENRLMELQRRVDEMSGKIQVVTQPPAPAPQPPAPKGPSFPEERQALYDFGKKAFDNGDNGLAREAFARFVKAFPKDKDLMDNVHYWTGEAFFADKQFDKAILSFQKVVTDFPKSEKADAALFKMGNSFTALGYDDDAKVFYEELLQKHPKSALVKDAKARLEELAKKKKKAPAPKKGGKK